MLKEIFEGIGEAIGLKAAEAVKETALNAIPNAITFAEGRLNKTKNERKELEGEIKTIEKRLKTKKIVDRTDDPSGDYRKSRMKCDQEIPYVRYEDESNASMPSKYTKAQQDYADLRLKKKELKIIKEKEKNQKISLKNTKEEFGPPTGTWGRR